MSGGISAGTIAMGVAAAAGGMMLAQAMAPKPSNPGAPPAPEKPPQTSKAPEVGSFRRQNQAVEGAMGSSGSTLLTGPEGVPNDLLGLGKATLLGQ